MVVKNEINLQDIIDKGTEDLKQPALGDRMLEIVHPYTTEFLRIFPERQINLIQQDPFFQWFRKLDRIKQAYALLDENGLVTEKNKDSVLSIALEFVVSNSIHFLIGAKIIYGNKKTRRSISPLKKQATKVTKALRVLRQKINLHQGIYCKYESKQYLLLAVIDDILRDHESYQRSIYSSGLMKGQEVREILTKRILHGLLVSFKEKNSAPRLLAHIALKVTGIFYPPMDISDATDVAVEIRENFIKDEKFSQQTIFNYLCYSIEEGVN